VGKLEFGVWMNDVCILVILLHEIGWIFNFHVLIIRVRKNFSFIIVTISIMCQASSGNKNDSGDISAVKIVI